MWKHNLSSRVFLQGMEFSSSANPLPMADSLREASGRNVYPSCATSSLAPSLALHCYDDCRCILSPRVCTSQWECPIKTILEQVKMVRETLALSTMWGMWQISAFPEQTGVIHLWHVVSRAAWHGLTGSCTTIYTGSDPHVPSTCRARGWISSFPRGNHESTLPRQIPPHLQQPLAKKVGRWFCAKCPKCFHFARAGWAHFPSISFQPFFHKDFSS